MVLERKDRRVRNERVVERDHQHREDGGEAHPRNTRRAISASNNSVRTAKPIAKKVANRVMTAGLCALSGHSGASSATQRKFVYPSTRSPGLKT